VPQHEIEACRHRRVRLQRRNACVGFSHVNVAPDTVQVSILTDTRRQNTGMPLPRPASVPRCLRGGRRVVRCKKRAILVGHDLSLALGQLQRAALLPAEAVRGDKGEEGQPHSGLPPPSSDEANSEGRRKQCMQANAIRICLQLQVASIKHECCRKRCSATETTTCSTAGATAKWALQCCKQQAQFHWCCEGFCDQTLGSHLRRRRARRPARRSRRCQRIWFEGFD